MEGMGERFARDAVNGESFKVPGSMTYADWKAQQDKLYGAGTVDLEQKKSYNYSRDKKALEEYKSVLGKNAPASLSEYQDIRYSEDWAAFKAYVKSIKSGELSALANFELYKSKSAEIDRTLVGVVTSNGLTVTGKSNHYIARTIGSISQRRNGVDVPEAHTTIVNPIRIEPVKVAKNGRSQRFVGKSSAVTINPDTGVLIQVNPLRTRK
jgi:hypothetical protein